MLERKPVSSWPASAAFDFVAQHEGLRLEAYLCPAGHWTIGYGLTRVSGVPVHAGMKISEDRARQLLTQELKRVQDQLAGLVKVKVSRGEFIALTDFCFNVGAGNLGHSTLLRKLNQGEYMTAAYELRKWTYAGGKSLPGLVRRREDELAKWKEGY